MSSYSIAIRIKRDSDLDQVYQAWVTANGWTQSEFLEHAIRELAGLEPPYRDSMEQATLKRLTDLVEHLEAVAARLESGGVITPSEGQQVREAMEQAVPDAIRATLLRIKREPLKGE